MSVPIINPPTFTRSSVAYLSNGTQVAANQPRFEQGKFGKAILIEEETMNLVDFDMDFRSWSSNNSNMASLTTKTGKHSFRVQGTSTVPGAYSYIYPAYATANVLHSASSWVRNLNSKPLRVGLRIRDGFNGGNLSDNVVVVVPPGQELPIRVTSYSPVSLNQVTVAWSVYSDSDDGTVDAEIYMCQLEAKPYATSFIDGTRAAETLTIPTAGVLNPQKGTIEISCMKPKYLNYNARVLWVEKENSRFGIHDNPSGGLVWAYNSTDTQLGAGQLLEGQWHYLAMSWNRDEGWAKCYVDGNHIRTIVFEPGTNPGFVGSELLGIGCRPAYAGLYFNGFFDDIRISNRARTDEEILAAYQNNAPLVVDKWTTYKLNFDDNLNFEQGAYTSSALENIYAEYDIINSTTKKYIYKIEWLTPQEEVIGDVIGDIISGSANFDATNNNRRSVSLTLRNLNKQYIPSPTSKMWINNKFRLLCGYEYNGEQILYNQGIYVLGNPSLLSTPTQKEVTIEGLDKWVLLDGTIAGTLANKYIINVDTRIDEAVKSIIIDLIGETKYIIDECSVLTPYTIEKPAGSTIADMLLELANMVSYSVYYNEEGYLCFKNPLKPEDYAITPPVWQYTTSGLYLQSTRELNWNDIKNSIIVYGMTENGYQYTATAKDLTGSELSIDKIGERVKVIEDDNIYSDDLCQQRANYELQQSIMAQETVNITSIPNFKLKLDDVINVEDENNGTTGNYVIRNISYDLSYRSTMNIGVWAIRHIG